MIVWLRFWIAEIGVPAAIRPMTGIDDRPTVVLRPAAELRGALARARPPSTMLGVNRRWRRAPPAFSGIRTTSRARARFGQAADEAALLQGGDEAMDARLRLEVQRLLHLVEGRRHPGLAQALVNEAEQFVLFARQHVGPCCSAWEQF